MNLFACEKCKREITSILVKEIIIILNIDSNLEMASRCHFENTVSECTAQLLDLSLKKQ